MYVIMISRPWGGYGPNDFRGPPIGIPLRRQRLRRRTRWNHAGTGCRPEPLASRHDSEGTAAAPARPTAPLERQSIPGTHTCPRHGADEARIPTPSADSVTVVTRSLPEPPMSTTAVARCTPRVIVYGMAQTATAFPDLIAHSVFRRLASTPQSNVRSNISRTRWHGRTSSPLDRSLRFLDQTVKTNNRMNRTRRCPFASAG